LFPVVFPFLLALLPTTGPALTDQVLHLGLWVYLGVFIVIMLASTIVGGTIPDNTFLVITGAVAADNGLPVLWFLAMAIGGGFAGYEINYWSGRLFGLTVCQGRCPAVLADTNVRRGLDLVDRFGPLSLVLSRFLPVLNLPSFIAGAETMNYRKYVVYNLISALLWAGSLMTIGYFLGGISIVGEYLDYVTDFFIIITIATVLIAVGIFIRDNRQQLKR
jgi:membrane-associated protein